MREIRYLLVKIKYRLKRRDKEVINQYFRDMGMKIGKGCNIVPNITTTEPYLIEIGNNTTLAGGVSLCTHDNSVSKIIPNCTDMFGRIVIGNNCFIGQNALVMYGVTIADNTIVAAGSVVASSFLEGGLIIGGNPARIIGTCKEFAEKYEDKVFNLDLIPKDQLKKRIEQSDKLIERHS